MSSFQAFVNPLELIKVSLSMPCPAKLYQALAKLSDAVASASQLI